MILTLLRLLRFSLPCALLFILHNLSAQPAEPEKQLYNPSENYLYNDAALVHTFDYFDSLYYGLRPFRIAHIGDSHVKSGFYAESFASLMDSLIKRKINPALLLDSAYKMVDLLVIAKNGAMAKTILESVFDDTAMLYFNPDLTIISLGTNEAYNNLGMDTLAGNNEALIRRVMRTAPNSDILITTPGDSQKRYYTKVRISKKKRRYRTITNYTKNNYLPSVVDYYANLPEKMQVAVWNFYNVMGKEGAIMNWIDSGLAQPDRVHLNRQGYRLQARLLFDALDKTLEK